MANRNQYPPPTIDTLLARLEAHTIVPRFPNSAPDFDACHLWRGAQSRGSWRETEYPSIWIGQRRGAGERTGYGFRVNRLVLLLKAIREDQDCAQVPGETLLAWLQRVNDRFRAYEAAHTCDRSSCVNVFHLAWETHAENVENARRRRELRDRGEAETAGKLGTQQDRVEAVRDY